MLSGSGGGNAIFGDGILIDSGPANLGMFGVSITAFATSVGSPLRTYFPAGGFGLLVERCTFNGPGTTQLYSIYNQGMGLFEIRDSFIGNTGVYTNSGTFVMSNILSENLGTPSFLVYDDPFSLSSNLDLRNIEMADNFAGPPQGGQFLITTTSAGSASGAQSFTFISCRGWFTQMVGGSGLNGAFVSGIQGPLGITTGIVQVDTAGDLNVFRRSGIGGPFQTNSSLAVYGFNPANAAMVVQAASGQTGHTADWNSFAGTGGDLAWLGATGGFNANAVTTPILSVSSGAFNNTFINPTLTVNRTITLMDGNTAAPAVVSFTTTAATSDVVTVQGATASSHCTLTERNALAAVMKAAGGTYVSATGTNSVTVTHPATAGAIFDIFVTGV